MNKELKKLYHLLALEYNCQIEDFTKKENVITIPVLHDGRRKYNDKPYFFQMVTTGNNAVITADKKLHPFFEKFVKGKPGHYLFEIPNLILVQKELNIYGYELTTTSHMFLPACEVKPVKNYEVKWYFDKEIRQFYEDERFPNAILPGFHEERPDTIVVCAYDGEKIMGMAGCSEDALGWCQIGIDVMPEYRSKGVGTYLVTLLKNKITEQGKIPFYGTSLSNYHSWNIAMNSGFSPVWVEIGCKRSRSI